MDGLEEIHNLQQHINDVNNVVNLGEQVRKPKTYKKRLDPFEIYTNKEFKKNYRIPKTVARQIIALLDNNQKPNNRGLPVPISLQVLATLRYLAKGAYQADIAELHGFSQSTLSTVVGKIVRAICAHRDTFIKFPTSAADLRAKKEQFYNVAHMPGIVGAIDCTHVKIKNPGGDQAATYVNRKGFFSLNVQVICDAQMSILNIVAKWRGSVHDSRIWENCILKNKFCNHEISGILVGDGGYALKPNMLTPVLNPQTLQEENYNRAHIRTRNCVERLFGVWKNKFRAFFNGLQTSLETTKAAVVTLAIIHNIYMQHKLNNEDESDDDSDSSDYDEEESENFNVRGIMRERHQGALFRMQYIRHNF